jgi:hypothetical protein
MEEKFAGMIHEECRKDQLAFAAMTEYAYGIMTSLNSESLSISSACANVKNLGYVPSAKVRLYGEEFEVLSDPFPEAGGIAVHVKATKDSRFCVLQLPATILQSVRRRANQAA